MSWEPFGFMFFSTVEAFSLYWLIMTLFRYKAQHYAWQALYVILFMNFQSYILRNELDLAAYVPLICLLLYILLFKCIVKIPLAWSIITTVLGYAVFTFLQGVLIRCMFGSIAEIQANVYNGYIIQTNTAFFIMLLSYVLYRTGMGFKFDFERLKLALDDILAVFIVVVFFIMISFVFYYKKDFLNLLFFAMMAFFFLYYALRKEKK